MLLSLTSLSFFHRFTFCDVIEFSHWYFCDLVGGWLIARQLRWDQDFTGLVGSNDALFAMVRSSSLIKRHFDPAEHFHQNDW